MADRSRAAGCLLGIACGDALGRPVAGLTGRQITREYGRITEMRGGDRPTGTVTEATELTRRLARSLAERGEFERTDATARYADESDRDRGSRDPGTGDDPEQGATGLVRAGPFSIAYRDDTVALADAVVAAANADADCVAASVALARVLASLLDGDDPGTALAATQRQSRDRGAPERLRTALTVADDPSLVSLRSDGDTIDTLEVGLHDGLTAGTAEEAVVTAVNRGGRTTAVGAATGAVAGARFGVDALPDRWLDVLSIEEELRELADSLERIGIE